MTVLAGFPVCLPAQCPVQKPLGFRLTATLIRPCASVLVPFYPTFQLGKRKARSLSRFLTLPVKNRTCHFDGIRLSTFDSSPWGDP